MSDYAFVHGTTRDRDNHFTRMALAHLEAARDARERWDRIVTDAVYHYGDESSEQFPAMAGDAYCVPRVGNRTPISGIYRAHFPEGIKSALRLYARVIAEQTDLAYACWHRAGRRVQTLQPLSQDARRLADGRVSYY